LSVTPVHAQDMDEDEDDEFGLPDVGPPISEMSLSAHKRHDLYWADKRKVDAIQKRGFLKESRHEFTLHTGVIANDEFYTYVAMGGRYSYFFAEDIGMEIWGTYEHALESDFRDLLQNRAEQLLKVEVPQSVLLLAGVNAVWSPLHGKFAMFDSSLVHFDAYLSLGAGFILTMIRDLVGSETGLEPDMAGNVGMGFRIFLTDWVSLRTDMRQYFYPAWDPQGDESAKVAHPFEITLGVSFWTAAPE
jgi:outer membrane beta-barrel protein